MQKLKLLFCWDLERFAYSKLGKELITCIVEEDFGILVEEIRWRERVGVWERVGKKKWSTCVSQMLCFCTSQAGNPFSTHLTTSALFTNFDLSYAGNCPTKFQEGYLVYECNHMCRCNKSCPNRILQNGVRVKLEVFKTEKKVTSFDWFKFFVRLVTLTIWVLLCHL